jgi:hypothetical protein
MNPICHQVIFRHDDFAQRSGLHASGDTQTAAQAAPAPPTESDHAERNATVDGKVHIHAASTDAPTLGRSSVANGVGGQQDKARATDRNGPVIHYLSTNGNNHKFTPKVGFAIAYAATELPCLSGALDRSGSRMLVRKTVVPECR